MKNIILNKLVQKAATIWSDIESEKATKIHVLNTVKDRLAAIATPHEENDVKVEIVRQTCKRLKELYPAYAKNIDEILLPFEHHLKFDHMAVLPFKQIDSLTYRIFMNQNMMGFVS
ncbi:hypothetical protein KEM09_09630 [Carboxylicivirga mesophila]|uniref:Uncharacterized protein n=1 Tax=Carboxylicivirga mesophila TaxID=1166478 RepID=A0ABS5K9I0_9BACT|nr:hypothetical protein [Carboxylicivirga mesophila]MBS2211663.1 hypothetical protein [Carboxylicivirga mesophila]